MPSDTRPVRRVMASRFGPLVGLACAGALLAIGPAAPARDAWPPPPTSGLQIPAPPSPVRIPPGMSDEEVQKITCIPCHKRPMPDVLPRNMWRNEVAKMTLIRDLQPPRLDMNSVVLPPDMAAALRYLVKNAPDHLAAPERWPDPSESPVKFTHYGLSVPDMPNDPAVSNVELVDFDGDGKLDVLATEMRQGVVFWGHPQVPGSPLTEISSIPHPDHVTLADVDKDGIEDLLVADLGQFFPADHHDGAVIWMRGLGNGKFSGFWLDGWPRVADVETADFNNDGKNDLAVSSFGWVKTGMTAILENQTTDPRHPNFVTHVIDPRAGGIHIIPIDLNKDGKMDFITLLAQQYETVLSFTNVGNFQFEQRVLYAAPHPNWGSTGIQVVDFDKDGDPDVLFSHGDTFDDGIVKPYHGIQWLENTGGPTPWQDHDVVQMAGVHRAAAADIDGDGDLDIVACALLAGGSDQDETVLPALVWVEQTKPGVFVKHTIEVGFPRHATLAVRDIDGDGDMDVVTGYFSIGKPADSWIQVWINQSKQPVKKSG
jgi:hypothetical protein